MSASKKPKSPEDDAAVSLWQTFASVAASFFGVQSSKNRTRDFSKGRPLHFIVIALVMTVAFVTTIVVVVKLVLRNAGL